MLERGGGTSLVLAAGVIGTTADQLLETRVHTIYDGVHDLLLKHTPDVLVLEDLYAEYKFPRTALLMAHARGVVCLAARQCGVPVVALAPSVVKRAVAAHGAASKAQVQHSIGRILNLPEIPTPSHVADALALAWVGLSRVRTPDTPNDRAPERAGARTGAPSARGTEVSVPRPNDRAPERAGASPGARESK